MSEASSEVSSAGRPQVRRARRVLFVCAGNICRSPMAEALFRRLAEERSALLEVDVGSAGTIAMTGSRATRLAVEVMLEDYGIDLRGHRARPVDELSADLILALDRQVAREVKLLRVRGTVALLGDYAGFEGEEVDDPYGETVDMYRECAQQIDRLVQAAARRIEDEIC